MTLATFVMRGIAWRRLDAGFFISLVTYNSRPTDILALLDSMKSVASSALCVITPSKPFAIEILDGLFCK